ncbi:hypothetical protein BN1723_003505 [Verticillium longisporum]|uniref:Uncharacterized protein n=1 Tax=Verticillium longisporum TaxID=100787 RepID=A0A0G4M0G9_VERLO|nr:hypothetical protein BN1708_002450 [Verticillium longisporum]CRK27345.1 hypothetical protein BN1723_003505 [Verticillium longisporum]
MTDRPAVAISPCASYPNASGKECRSCHVTLRELPSDQGQGRRMQKAPERSNTVPTSKKAS